MTRPNIALVEPELRHEDAFLSAVKRSRRLHRHLVVPPGTPDEFRHYLNGLTRANQAGFLVAVGERGCIGGVINVSEIVRGAFQSAYLGYYAFVPHAGTGAMRRGLALVIDHCFGELCLHRLEANIQPGNRKSSGLVKRLGFRLEGLSPSYLKVSGEWRDHERWAILADEWAPRTSTGS